MMILAIDIGGSSVKSAIYDGELQGKQQFDSPLTWLAMAEKLDALISNYRQEYEIERIAFSVPGVPNKTTGWLEGASSLHYLHDVPFIEYFQKKHQLPVTFENDANCACQAEMALGQGQAAKNIVFLVIGTGIGGVTVLDGEIRSGQHYYGGEYGMMLVDGRHEWSILGSAVHMARKYSQGKDRDFSGQEVFALAEAGDQLAQSLCHDLYHYLALGLYNLQYIIDPELFILGGGITQHPELLENIEKALTEIMSYGQRCPLRPNIKLATFKNDANLIGAALTKIN